MTSDSANKSFFLMTKTLITSVLFLTMVILFSACEDDPILDSGSDEDCVGSYCLLVEPSDTNQKVEIEDNPEEF